MAQATGRSRQAAPRATRLSFSYEGGEVRLEAQQALEMRTPPSHSLEPPEGALGFWFELHDGAGRPLYRRVTENPIRFAVEVRTDEPTPGLAWRGVERPRGSFTLLVPAIEEAATIVLFSSPLGPDGALEPARRLVAFDLETGRAQEGGDRG